MKTIISIVIFFIIFGLVVISHEFGHLLLAKINGIKVNEFTVGFGPKLFSFNKGGTMYALRLLPFGGACIYDGADILPDKDDKQQEEEKLSEAASDGNDGDEKMFLDANVWSRIATVFAGPFFNLLLAYIFAIVIVSFKGSDLPVIQNVGENMAAEEAGLQTGDIITKINSEHIHTYGEVSLISALNRNGKPMKITYLRDGVKNTVTINPTYDAEDDRYYLGIFGGTAYIDCEGLSVFKYGWYEVEYWLKASYKSLLMILSGQGSKDDVAGPVGVAQFVGDTYETASEYGTGTVVLTMMNIVVLLSVNLGFLNLLPLPALDGGKLFFMLIEVVRGKPVPPEKEGMVHLVGIVLLLGLSIFVLYNDIARIFGF